MTQFTLPVFSNIWFFSAVFSILGRYCPLEVQGGSLLILTYSSEPALTYHSFADLSSLILRAGIPYANLAMLKPYLTGPETL